MPYRLSEGVPGVQSYVELTESIEFKELEEFSNRFIAVNKKELEGYSNKWALDPLHQWSRQWEYPFVYSRIQPVADSGAPLRILDAGSGATFFPYYIKSQYPLAEIYCSDYDEKLERVYAKINGKGENRIAFVRGDLRKLLYESEWFDVVYCISVLEHTQDYAAIVEEFHRVLRPGGRLVVTFDVSLDGTRDISLENGIILLRTLTERFQILEEISPDLNLQVSKPDAFTTLTAKQLNRNLLPWKFPAFIYRAKSIITGKPFGSWPPLLTVFCLSLSKMSETNAL